MKLNSVQNNSQNISFKALTKQGNDYNKSHIGLATALISSSILGVSQLASDIFKGQSIKTLGKPAAYAAGAVAVSALFGAVIDFVFNKLRAKDADKHPMPIEQKFIRDLNSKDFGIYYDSDNNEAILVNKKQAHKYQNIDGDRRKLDNKYTLKDNGSVTITDGRDRIVKFDKKTQVLGKAKTFIENNDFVKDIVDRAKHIAFHDDSQSEVIENE